MKPAVLFFLIALLTGASGAEVAAPEELFKWGEYDSLIRVLEPTVARPGAASGLASKSDSAAFAKSVLYLGVAYYATGRISRADQSFTQACALDPDVALDRFYVTEQIAMHFQAISRESRRQRQQKSALTAARNLPPGGGRATALKSRDEKAWLWWGLGMTALVAAGGGAYWFANQPEETEHITPIDTH